MNQSVKTKRKLCSFRSCLTLAILTALLLSPELTKAQTLSAGKGDLLAGFRKYNPAGSYQLVVKLGNITNFTALPAGTNIAISNFTPTQLSAAFANFNNLKWSVFSTVDGYSTPFAGYPVNTLWFTKARTALGTQTTAPVRDSSSSQNSTRVNIASIRENAIGMSAVLGAGANNTAVLVREPVGGSGGFTDFATFIVNPIDGSVGDFGGNLAAGNVENTTPASFTSTVVSDLYQSVPTGATDPVTGTNNGASYFVGYFTLKNDGTMTFTRASNLPPAPQIVSVTRTNATTYIAFTTSGSFSYSLYYTNSTGLTASVTNWPHLGTQTGDGSVKTLTDTTTDANRFYRVGVQ